jgi:hypothetical protein
MSRRLDGRFELCPEVEDRTEAGLALQRDVAAEQVRDLMRDRQPRPVP